MGKMHRDRDMTTTNFPMACNLGAIPADQRNEHLSTAEHLLTRLAAARHELPDGYAFRFAAEHYAQVTAFIANERRCCPFYSFTLEVPAGDGALALRITGPDGAKAMLAATLLAPPATQPGRTIGLMPTNRPVSVEACSCWAPAEPQVALP